MHKIAVLVPSYNEELVIQKTISSVLAAGFDSADVFVVDDCSTDKTVALVLQTNVNILPLRKNGGKAKALNAAIEYFDLYKKYDYIAFLDADSIVSSNFKWCIEQYIIEFPLVDLFVGQVKTHEGNYISSYRAMEYTFAHDFYKSGLPQSGSITGIFNYVTGSKTEIDFEIEGNERNNIVHMTSWIGENLSNEQSKSVLALPYPHEEFHNYKFIWIPGRIYFYINGVLHAVHSTVVPTEPAHIVINHWGTHNPNWGGFATPGVERWVWVKSVSFTPLL